MAASSMEGSDLTQDLEKPPTPMDGTITPEDDSRRNSAIEDSSDEDEELAELRRIRSAEKKAKKRKKAASRIQLLLPFHFSPMFMPLTTSYVDACVALENAAFTNPEHRCSPEKFEYRLSHFSDICFGLFCSVKPSEAEGFDIETLGAAKAVETSRADGAVHVLLAHAIATLGDSPTITDADMGYPQDWRSRSHDPAEHERGRTICLHSLAVAPKVQRVGVGRLALKSYIQIMNESGVADRIAIICEEYLIHYYRRFGFQNLGESKCSYAGGGWYDMVLELGGPPQPEREHRVHHRGFSMNIPKPKT